MNCDQFSEFCQNSKPWTSFPCLSTLPPTLFESIFDFVSLFKLFDYFHHKWQDRSNIAYLCTILHPFFKMFGNCWYWYFSLLVTYFIGRRPGRAGLFAIFSTQSNDFALGNPILQAIYSLSHPDFQSYLYLLAPISLVILNPIGFVFMEIGKQQDQAAGTNLNNSKWVLVKSVIKGICTNAVIGKFLYFFFFFASFLWISVKRWDKILRITLISSQKITHVKHCSRQWSLN